MLQEDVAITLDNLSFAYETTGKDTASCFKHFSLNFPFGIHTAIMGASGSGKSTLSKLLVGLLLPHAGQIIRHHSLSLPRDVVYCDQSALNAVFPWQTVRKNLQWPLQQIGWASTAIDLRVDQLLELFGLEHRSHAHPGQLSGGECQRLALARTIAWRPKFVVLDESLSALDTHNKSLAIAALQRFCNDDRSTLVLVTHSLSDALALANRVLIVGGSPVGAMADKSISLPYPRNSDSAAYQLVQDEMISTLRHGLL